MYILRLFPLLMAQTTTLDILFAIARHMGIPVIVERAAKWEEIATDTGLPAASAVWDGSKLVIQNLRAETFAHEIAHWMVATEEQRELVNYGLHNRDTEPDPTGQIHEHLLSAARGLAKELNRRDS